MSYASFENLEYGKYTVFPHFFSYMLWHIELKFCTWLCSDVLQSKFECHLFASIFSPPPVKPGGTIGLHSVSLSVTLVFRTFLSTSLHILSWNFAYHFCFTVLQIKFDSCYFASIFVWVMPLLELRTEEIRSFPHFFPICFDILSWNFLYDSLLLYYRSSSSVITFRQFL